ncbi:MAG TPA: recombinase family protein [Bryobacteraceae bacterium]|nr:recombinase family protein [Bryobacteraceae bacterium]
MNTLSLEFSLHFDRKAISMSKTHAIEMIVGYARTSTVDQLAGFEAQLRELGAAGCEKTFQEQVSSVAEREQLNAAIEYVREGDIFVVAKLDRLARSVPDLMAILQTLGRKRVRVRILNLGMDTQTPTGKLMLTVLGAIAKSEGRYKGRKPIETERRQCSQTGRRGRYPNCHCQPSRYR